ncbi:unnamed protein product [Caenorhabditis bovis]|uniref:Uncharacterized protein n=1 Tax=Caenorhabditis bovis TaxID=2654633 RepID=A0A8S1F1M1_9PELO|nr:unnamed protein product [Caenorhabditis bovis]
MSFTVPVYVDDEPEVRSNTWDLIESTRTFQRSATRRTVSYASEHSNGHLSTVAQFRELPERQITPTRVASRYQFQYVTRRLSSGARRTTVELAHTERPLFDENPKSEHEHEQQKVELISLFDLFYKCVCV